MQINALRFRLEAEFEPRLIRMTPGIGTYQQYLAYSGPASLLEHIAHALRYVFEGRPDPQIAEAAVHIADAAGQTWIIDRKPGQLRVLLNNQPVEDADALLHLAKALRDENETRHGQPSTLSLKIASYAIDATGNHWRKLGEGESPTTPLAMTEIIAGQIRELTQACAKELGIPALLDAQATQQLASELAPLLDGYREICRQYRELGGGQEPAPSDSDEIARLTTEVALIDELASKTEPLFVPGASLKALKDELAAAEECSSKLFTVLGLKANPQGTLSAPDFRQPLELLCRLEAQAKLIRAAQAARKAMEQRIEPLQRLYLDSTEATVVADRQIVQELESYLGDLQNRLLQLRSLEAQTPRPNTWLSKLKNKATQMAHDTPHELPIGEPPVDDNFGADYDPARAAGRGPLALDNQLAPAQQAVAKALSRLSELEDSVRQTRDRKASIMQQLDATHEQLVKEYGRLRDEWLLLAKERELPERLTLDKLIEIISFYSEISELMARQRRAAERVAAYRTALVDAERLVLSWREKTFSQKSTNISNTSILLSETRDILRYHEAKKRRLTLLREKSGERTAEESIRALLRRRRKDLLERWHNLFATKNWAVPPIHAEGLTAFLQRASLIKALGLIEGAARGQTPPDQASPFAQDQDELLMATYICTRPALDAGQRQALLAAVKAGHSDQLRLLLLADHQAVQDLLACGCGAARDMPPPRREVPRGAAPALPATTSSVAVAPRARATLATQGARTPPAPPAMPADGNTSVLSPKALRAIAALKGKRGP